MRMMPVKTRPVLRHVRVRIVLWVIAVRMRELHGNPDVWLLESPEPADGSPWAQTQACANGAAPLSVGSVSDMAALQARTRINAAHDYFAVLRMAMSNRRVYSLYAICRSTIEACAFATWVLDPAAEPAQRLLRGLLLTRQSLDKQLRSMRELQEDPYGELDAAGLADLAETRSRTESNRDDVNRAIEDLRASHEATNTPPERPAPVPSATVRIREMLCEDMGMLQGSDAYHRMSGVAHSDPLAILATWNFSEDKLSIDYYSLLEFLHLAICSIVFSLERRSVCWGQPYKSRGLFKVIRSLERVIEGEPDVHPM